MDEVDSSVTRPFSLFKKIFIKAELDCYRQMKQNHFPKGLYTVYMFVLRPIAKVTDDIKLCSETSDS